jgi:hypothetical protein
MARRQRETFTGTSLPLPHANPGNDTDDDVIGVITPQTRLLLSVL